MTIQTLLKALAGVVAVGGMALLLTNQWRYQTLGEIPVRRHGLSGEVDQEGARAL